MYALKFTSHYVSINSLNALATLAFDSNLHPTMYLLIRPRNRCNFALALYLHPTMYLLIPWSPNEVALLIVAFTSHYVSINSMKFETKEYGYTNLHPTMYLLIHKCTK